MAKKRVYEIAKEQGLASADVVDRLKAAGVEVSGNFSGVDEADAARVFGGGKAAGAAKQAAPAAPRKGDAARPKKPAGTKEGKKAPATAAPAAKKPAATGKAAPRAAAGQEGKAPEAKAGAQAPQKRQVKRPAPKPEMHGKRRRVIIDPSAAKRHSFVPSGRQRSKQKGQRKDSREATAVVEMESVEQAPPAEPGAPVKVNSGATVKEVSAALGVSTADIIKRLMSYGEMATITQSLSDEAISTLADDLERVVEIAHLEEEEEPEIVDREEDLRPRAPVVTIMGHVDHGKTSLLDAIRETEVTATEAGGITQHIGAYQVEHEGKRITFLDTPGHEAFTAMRARGAKVTDVSVLVVAADDGVMPQTVEAIDHSKAAGVPILVAVNKIDKPEATPERVRQELVEHELVPEEWGGDTIFVDVSAKQKTNLDSLLEMILLVSEVQELKANPDAKASGVVIESKLDPGRGVVATILVNRGTMHVGDAIVGGPASGKVKAMSDFRGKPIKEASPSVPVEVLGFDVVPQAGEHVRVVEDERRARTLAHRRADRIKAEALARRRAFTLDDVFDRIKEGEVKDLNLIIKADVAGSVEALEEALRQIRHEEVKINIIHTGVGAINESDVMLAAASRAIVLGFNVRPSSAAKTVADLEGVDVRTYSVIYKVTEDVKAALIGMLEPTFVEEELGEAEIRQVFKASRIGNIAGCYVTRGKVTRNAQVRLVREGTIVHTGKLASLKRFKEDTREVEEGYECGIHLEDYNDIKEGDVLEFFETKEVKRS
ncbi:MAG: translation initiation factor IF-2 [Gaiellales bacterium]|nr:MAG: translation initiation factor IF-2 [Gaiellales bacterium]